MTESTALWDESLPKTALPSPVGQQLWKQEQVEKAYSPPGSWAAF